MSVNVIIDECFSDFLEEEEKYSVVPCLQDYKNIFILKAFTKMYAMAGIRLGYGISFNKELIQKVSGIGQPWSVSTVAQKAGVQALKEIEFVNKTKFIIKENRQYLIKEIRTLGFKVYDSKVNYVLFKSSVKDLKLKLEKYGILIRSCSNYKNLDDSFYRIAVKSKEDCERFINSLKEIIKAG